MPYDASRRRPTASESPIAQDLRRTPLFETHQALGARMLPFAGWEMPIHYTGILDEAKAVRSRAGIFDVSHMGRVEIHGPGAGGFLDRVLSFDVPGSAVGRARYGVICNDEGGIIDDCITYRLDDERFLLVPNAANTEVVLAWLHRWGPGDIELNDITSEGAMVALQGPDAQQLLGKLTDHDLYALRPFSIVSARIAGADSLVARTGYTGEDGFEVVLSREVAPEVWNLLTEKGATLCGLGARDVLRLEAGLLLHGNDMDIHTNPYEAGLGRFVDPDRDAYIAGPALRRIRDRGSERVLVGFHMVGRGIPRHGYRIMEGSRQIGRVTSGGVSRTLDTTIGLGYVPGDFSSPGSRFQIDVRGRPVEAMVTALPFFSRRRSA